jgi:hypothetical protein
MNDVTKPLAGGRLAEADNDAFLGNDGAENSPKAAHVSRAIAPFKREFIAEALRIASIKSSHAADDIELGDTFAPSAGSGSRSSI